ncbi:hypothetical protein TH25_00910 [Thalassospira profundimaris]|uniref:Uncharacterized protein n=1 Tax=Thalassospira profundimaris TaxID=502049 RepID=A0A367XLC8_9PROT|nr:hypothetical protein [Thalassospira profundimaris]RCK53960.1 hypothetical protein TH25_00910 [Thalassospira profundimaris]
MSSPMTLMLTLENRHATTPLHLTSLAPQEGWQTPPPRHLAPGTRQTCRIDTSDRLAITLHYGSWHIGISLENGKLEVEPGLAEIEYQAISGHQADITLRLG